MKNRNVLIERAHNVASTINKKRRFIQRHITVTFQKIFYFLSNLSIYHGL